MSMSMGVNEYQILTFVTMLIEQVGYLQQESKPSLFVLVSLCRCGCRRGGCFGVEARISLLPIMY